ncbi:MAG TPA: hypothetical protein VHN11_11720 [Xanthobacteraceae bacterium]|jgi:hypothetical protein|nr:hypothetical protein [Xanthobacteraceae bacterium]
MVDAYDGRASGAVNGIDQGCGTVTDLTDSKPTATILETGWR